MGYENMTDNDKTQIMEIAFAYKSTEIRKLRAEKKLNELINESIENKDFDKAEEVKKLFFVLNNETAKAEAYKDVMRIMYITVNDYDRVECHYKLIGVLETLHGNLYWRVL